MAAKFPTPVHQFGEGIQVVAETQLIAPYAVPAANFLRITDFGCTSDAGAGAGTFYWLSTGVAGAAGHFYQLYMAAAGNMKVLFESPIEIGAGLSVYCHYNGGAALGAAYWDGELYA